VLSPEALVSASARFLNCLSLKCTRKDQFELLPSTNRALRKWVRFCCDLFAVMRTVSYAYTFGFHQTHKTWVRWVWFHSFGSAKRSGNAKNSYDLLQLFIDGRLFWTDKTGFTQFSPKPECTRHEYKQHILIQIGFRSRGKSNMFMNFYKLCCGYLHCYVLKHIMLFLRQSSQLRDADLRW